MTTTPNPSPGKLVPVTVALIIVALGTFILWRQYQLAAELETLRAAAAKPAPAEPPRPVANSPIPADNPTHDGSSWQHDIAAAKARIGELEREQQKTADLLNQAIAELNRLTATAERATYRSWGPEQLLGEPDTPNAGDHPTAWAAAEQDAGPEWLQLGYDRAVEIKQVRVRETDHPGAVTKVTALLDNGRELLIWQGTEQSGPAPYDATFNAPGGIVAKSVRVYLDTSLTPGWEEIDAVELLGTDGTRQWATSASASSTYATPRQSS